MIDLAAEIAECEREGLECAMAYAIQFPILYEQVPTKKAIMKIKPGSKIWVRFLKEKYYKQYYVVSKMADPVTDTIEVYGFVSKLDIPISAIFEID